MKNNTSIFIAVGLFSILFYGCKKEYLNPDNDISCALNFQDHAKNSRYQALLDSYTKKGLVGLTVLVDNPADGLWMGSSGYADIENNVKMTPCHFHHTASIYKTYIAVIIMQLVEEGKLNLDDYINKYISSDILDKLPNGNKVTIKNLLQHRSGMPDIFEEDFILSFFNHPGKTYSTEELLEFVYNKKPLSEPGTEFYYSDADVALLSLVINKIEGDYEQSLQTRIFDVMNLTETLILNTPADAPLGLADSYWDRYGDENIENISDYQIALTSGCKGTDGIITTANDMKIFIEALVGGDLVSDSSLSQMTDFLEVPESAREQLGISGYGLGLMKVNVSRDTWYGHFGNHIGSGAIALYNPERNITLVVFENTGTFLSDKIKPLLYYQLIKDIEEIAY
jgi:D-alanyl-D-alanine carboxypeptidase